MATSELSGAALSSFVEFWLVLLTYCVAKACAVALLTRAVILFATRVRAWAGKSADCHHKFRLKRSLLINGWNFVAQNKQCVIRPIVCSVDT